MVDSTEMAQKLEKSLTELYGPMLTGEVLAQCLGYPSRDALRQAIARNKCPVHTFLVENRKGRYAMTADVSVWLAKCGAKAD